MSQHIIHPLRQPLGRPAIGAHFTFSEGQFADRMIRVELHELQKADIGRKYTHKDRRSLDPPPVVQLKLFEIVDSTHVTEIEISSYKDVEIAGLLCHVDLFAVRSTPQADAGPSIPLRQATSRVSSISSSPVDEGVHASPSIPAATTNAAQSEVLTHVNGSRITEQSICTTALVGSTVIEATSLEREGKDTLMYTFSDLSVRQEGTFILRYRVFDAVSKARGSESLPVLAECYGGPFEIFPTKLFPGLQPSTELTRHLSRYGVRLNMRETERRKPKSQEHPPRRNVRIAPASSSEHSQDQPLPSI